MSVCIWALQWKTIRLMILARLFPLWLILSWGEYQSGEVLLSRTSGSLWEKCWRQVWIHTSLQQSEAASSVETFVCISVVEKTVLKWTLAAVPENREEAGTGLEMGGGGWHTLESLAFGPKQGVIFRVFFLKKRTAEKGGSQWKDSLCREIIHRQISPTEGHSGANKPSWSLH